LNSGLANNQVAIFEWEWAPPLQHCMRTAFNRLLGLSALTLSGCVDFREWASDQDSTPVVWVVFLGALAALGVHRIVLAAKSHQDDEP
jgi:hypothetical protein